MTTAQLPAHIDWSVRLRRDATTSVGADGRTELTAPFRSTRLAPLGIALSGAVTALADGLCTDAQLTTLVTEAEGFAASIKLQLLLRKLRDAGWLEHTVTVDDRPLATLRPLGDTAVGIDATGVPPASRYRLSRFAVLRAEAGSLVADTALSAAAVELVDARCVSLIGLLARGTSAEDAAQQVPDLGVHAVAAVLGLLDAAHLLTPDDPAVDPETSGLSLAQWSATDLLLHATARSGRRGGGYGGTYRLAGRFPPVPALLPAGDPDPVRPPVPDLAAITQRDPALTAVLEQRRSLRVHDDDAPITVAQLGELLYRTIRVRRTIDTGGDTLVDRPVPAGGSLHELEIYPVVNLCDGLAPGVWHYGSQQHTFERVADPSPATSELLAHARAASLMDRDPQVLLVIAARFGRVMWKYESMAYALILKHVGVVQQTLYLVATAMGLAPCAQGGGSADLFAAASSLDYYEQGSVGEFVIGSRGAEAKSMWEAGT